MLDCNAQVKDTFRKQHGLHFKSFFLIVNLKKKSENKTKDMFSQLLKSGPQQLSNLLQEIIAHKALPKCHKHTCNIFTEAYSSKWYNFPCAAVFGPEVLFRDTKSLEVFWQPPTWQFTASQKITVKCCQIRGWRMDLHICICNIKLIVGWW